VVDGLGATVAALPGARGDLVSSDTVVSQRPSAMAVQLEGRLG
jgi:hypothetical protein